MVAVGNLLRVPHRPRHSVIRRFGAPIVALLLLLSACTVDTTGPRDARRPRRPRTATASATASPTDASKITFSDCSRLLDVSGAGIPSARLKSLTFQCGKVTVPLDYADPTGRTISIQIVKVHDTDQKNRVGSLLVNPGGPGESGLTVPLALAADAPNDLLQHFDLIGFDPRGVGLSSPLDCVTDTQKDAIVALDSDPRTAAGLAAAKQDWDLVAQECAAQYPGTLADYNTTYTAMDMDRIRAALGDKKLSYLGFSYGTALGWTYAHLYPTNVRAAVLDGAVDPTLDFTGFLTQQLTGFESAFDQFSADCLTRPACAAMGQPRAAVIALAAAAQANPIKSSLKGETRTADGGVVLTAVSEALYSKEFWPDLGDAIVAAQKGDSKLLFELADEYWERNADGSFSNILDANTAILCNDQATRPTDASIQAAATQWATQYPMLGLWFSLELVQCEDWPASGHTLPAATAAGSVPILVVGNTHDPATPYLWAQHLTAALTTGVLLTWEGEGHTAYDQGSSCIDDKVDNYLITGVPPAVGTICPA